MIVTADQTGLSKPKIIMIMKNNTMATEVDLSVKEQVFNVLCNHKNCTSGGIANILNVRTFSVLRALSELIKEGEIKQQRGRVVDGYPDPRFRSYKMIKEKYTSIKLFDL